MRGQNSSHLNLQNIKIVATNGLGVSQISIKAALQKKSDFISRSYQVYGYYALLNIENKQNTVEKDYCIYIKSKLLLWTEICNKKFLFESLFQ